MDHIKQMKFLSAPLQCFQNLKQIDSCRRSDTSWKRSSKQAYVKQMGRIGQFLCSEFHTWWIWEQYWLGVTSSSWIDRYTYQYCGGRLNFPCPIHKAYWSSRVNCFLLQHYMEACGQHCALTTLCLGKKHRRHWIGIWVGPGASVHILEKRKASYLSLDLNSSLSIL
jgi:hypothetical protein